MFNDQSKTSIARIVFYVPPIMTAAYLAYHRHQRPRMAWLILLFFSIIRLIAGILVILFEQKPTTGLMIASVILLNTGVFPLVAATLGLIQIIMSLEQKVDPRVCQCLLLSRFLFFVGLGLQIVGGCLEGIDSASDVTIGVKLVKAGYSIVVVFVACLLAVQAYLWTYCTDICDTSHTVLKFMALALPFIVVHITYLFLSIAYGSDLRWNNLAGPIAPFLLWGC